MVKVVYNFGVYDILHYGHLESLVELKKLFDKVYVGIFTDKVAKSFKRKPTMKYNERYKFMEILGKQMGFEVMKQNKLDPKNNVNIIKREHKKNRPDYEIYVAKGRGARFEDYKRPNYILMPYHEGISTSEIINRIKNDNTK